MATKKTSPNKASNSNSTSGYTVKGSPADAGQTKAINTILATAKSIGASRMVMIAIIMCVTQESVIRNKRTGDYARADTIGYFQQGPEWLSPSDTGDPAKGTSVFLLGHESPHFSGTDKGKRGWKQWHGSVDRVPAPLTLAGAIQMVQRSDPKYNHLLAKWQPEATKTVDRWLENPTEAEAGDSSESKTEKRKSYRFKREKGEHSWAAMQRLGEEVGWRLYESNGKIRYASEPFLLKQKAVAKISPLDPYILDGFSFDIDSEGPVDSVSFSAMSNRWGLIPGQVVILHGAGPANGRWLIASVSSSLFSDVTDIELKSAERPEREPAPETTSSGSAGSGSGQTGGDEAPDSSSGGTLTTTGGAQGIVDQCVRLAQRVGGSSVWMSSGFRGGAITTSGNVSDHSFNSAQRAARDIAKRGVNVPSPELDKAAKAIMDAFGQDYTPGQKIDTKFVWRGYRVQVLWRTNTGGNHFNHVHVGVAKQ